MRTLTTAQTAALDAPRYAVHTRVYAENADGNFRPIHNLENWDWVDGVDYGEDIDMPVARATLRLFRNVYQMSLAPLVESSRFNRDAADVYAPLLDLGREVIVETITGSEGVEPTPTNHRWFMLTDQTWNDVSGQTWQDLVGDNPPELVFRGKIQSIDWADRVQVAVDDPGADIRDTFIETERQYGADDGSVLAEDVMQGILDDNVGGVSLFVPTPSNFAIRLYNQRKEPVLNALRNVALQRAWDLRYRYQESTGNFELTFQAPDRTKTLPDHTFGPDRYLDVQRITVAKAGIRNAIRVVYTDAADGLRKTIEVTDPVSINRYGRLFMEMAEAAASQIDTEPEATDMATGALDLANPKAELEIPLHYFYAAQLGDLYRFEANGDHFDVDQDLAVVGIRHVLSGSMSGGQDRTTLTVRGKPAGAYKDWMARAAVPGIAPPGKFFGPTKPTGVVATGIIKGIAVDFDTPNWKQRWDRSEVHVSTLQGFTPDASTLAAKGRDDHFEITNGLVAGTTYFVRVIHVDDQDNKSTASDEVSAVAGRVQSQDIEEGAVTEVGTDVFSDTNVSTTSTTFVDIPNTELSINLGIPAVVFFYSNVEIRNPATDAAFARILLDGSELFGTLRRITSSTTLVIWVRVLNLSSGAHTMVVQYRAASGSTVTSFRRSTGFTIFKR